MSKRSFLLLLAGLTLLGGSALQAQTQTALPPQRNAVPTGNAAFSDPAWIERFVGSYPTLAAVEPEFKAEDREVLAQIQPLIQNNPQQAIQIVEETIRIDPEANPAYYFILGNLYVQVENYREAIRNYERAVDEFPSFLRVYKNLGYLYYAQENFDKAIEIYSKAVSLGDQDSRTFGLLGIMYLDKELYASAESAFQNALLNDPRNKDWKTLLARTYLLQEKWQQANHALRELIIQNPNDSDLWLLQANTYLGMDEIDKAASNFEVVRRMGGATSDSLNLLGDIYMNRQMPDLALEAYLASVRQQPSQPVDRPVQAVRTFVNFGNYEAAAELINNIRDSFGSRLSEENQLDLLNLEAQVAIAQGEGERAAQVLEEILQRDPTNGNALMGLGRYYGDQADDISTEIAEVRNDQAESVERQNQIAALEKEKNETLERSIMMYERAAESLEKDVQRAALVQLGQLLVREKRWEDAADALNRAQSVEYDENVQQYLEQVERVARVLRVSQES